MEHFVGIDVAKDRLGVHLRPSGESFAVGRDGEGLARLVERLRALAPALVVLEATGGSREWWPAPLPQRSCRWRWSTHARSAILAPPANWPRPTGSTPRQSRISRPPARAIANTQAQALGELVAGRRQVIEMMVAGRNRRRTATQRRVIRAIECHLALVQAELSELGRRYRPCHPQQSGLAGRCRSLADLARRRPGDAANLDRRTAGTRSIDPPQDRRLAGVAPINRDSGRPTVRTALYTAALVASRANPTIAAHYNKLRTAGKTGKQALVACMRKLLVILNAILRDRKPWQPA